MVRDVQRALVALAGVALLLGCAGCRPPAPEPIETFPAGPDGLGVRFSIVVIDVGESDATLILGPGDPDERVAMLVDAGHRQAVVSILDELQVEQLHYAVLSRYDPDHMRGFVEEPGLLWSQAMVVEEAKEKPAADRAAELAEELTQELAKQKAAREQADADGEAGAEDDDGTGDGADDEEAADEETGADDAATEPEPLVLQRPGASRADQDAASDLPRHLLCNATEFAPRRGIVDPGSPPSHERHGQTWWQCAGQLGREIEHLAVENGKHVGAQIDLGEGLTARIVAGGGHVWGYDQPFGGADDTGEHGIVLLISNGQGFEFLLLPDLADKERRALLGTSIADALADKIMNEGMDIEVLRVANHGGENATSRRLLSRAKPEVAIISTGDEQAEGIHHPRCRALNALSSGGVGLVLQTEGGRPDCSPRDEERRFVVDGSIKIDVTGSDYTISTLGSQSPVSGKKTRHIAFACSVRRGCYWFKEWES